MLNDIFKFFFFRGKNTRPWYSIKETKDIIYNQPIHGICQASANAETFGDLSDSYNYEEFLSSNQNGDRKA